MHGVAPRDPQGLISDFLLIGSVHKKALLYVALQEMFDTGLVKTPRSPRSFPIILEPVKDSRARVCEGFLEFKAITVRDSYLLP